MAEVEVFEKKNHKHTTNPPKTNIFACRLKHMRERRRISRRVMSELCGLSGSVISKYERGERQPTLDALLIIADLLECSVDYLVGATDTPARYRK